MGLNQNDFIRMLFMSMVEDITLDIRWEVKSGMSMTLRQYQHIVILRRIASGASTESLASRSDIKARPILFRDADVRTDSPQLCSTTRNDGNGMDFSTLCTDVHG